MGSAYNVLDDIMAIEEADAGGAELDACIQRLINSGEGWQLQGHFGRTMMAAIEEGRCLLGQHPAQDAYGHKIPSRHEVLQGSKGSLEFVASKSGLEHAVAMASIDGDEKP